MRVRLIKKLAERIDGVDLSGSEPGDLLDLAWPEARLLLAEGWAITERANEHRRGYRVSFASNPKAVAKIDS